MAKRLVEVKLVVRYSNGDEGIHSVAKLPIPKYISSLKAVDKDDALEQHALWITEWLKQAIARKELDDEQMGIMESW